ncbi:MAG: imidazole glycerol phosphate synthase subunit HisH [Candidatus Giovannonibacteria bacterium]|nr:MAG: imidazole glycerol phosphate synthase subunit HisH [Candidatus Giovannonibacteria bacterium]
MSEPKITIIDYGVGNLHSLRRAFKFFEIDAAISEDADEILNSDAVVLPGVGSFEAGMRGLKVRGLVDAVKEFAVSNKPMLGICLGAQILLSEGHEFGVFEGLDIIPGKVTRFPELAGGEKIPHIGWNRVSSPGGDAWNKDFYFVHSYILRPEKREHIFGLTTYGGQEFCSVVKKGNIYGTQFHPERSGDAGLEIIKNFIKIA